MWQPLHAPATRIKLVPMRNLVTGASGLIGGQITQQLVSDDEDVRILIRRNSDTRRLPDRRIEKVVGDLLDADSLRTAMQGIDVVYHCAGRVSDWGKREDFIRANVEGTRRVVQAALAADVRRLVYLSSAAVYGYRGGQQVQESEGFGSRRIPYIESKIAAEQVVWQAMKELDVVILRPVMVFGPGCQNYVGEVVRHLRNGSMLLLDHGRHQAGLAYVENVADACLLAGRIRHPDMRVFNICDGLPTTWRQYLDALADGLGVRRVRFSLPSRLAYCLAFGMENWGRLLQQRRRPLLTRLAVLELGTPQNYDISRARRQLGFEPVVDFDTAMQKTLDWVRKQP